MPNPKHDAFPDATALAERVRRGDVTPQELVDDAISRIEKRNSELGAVILPQFERARAEVAGTLPDGPFRGVPFLLKDLGAHLAGDPCHNGMRALKEAGWTEPDDTCFAARVRDAGFVVLGRTNSPELGLLPTTEPDAYPPTRNPWNTDHSSGGSSGGSAAAVAAGLVPVAHASDGGGSIRIPAAHCGLVGLKASRGRNSFGPDLGERWSGFSSEGFVTHSVRDAAALADLVAGDVAGDPYVAPALPGPLAGEVGVAPGTLRVGVLDHGLRDVAIDPECARAAADAGKLLETLGHQVEASHPEALDDPQSPIGYVKVVAANVAFALTRWGEKLGHALGEEDVETLTWAVAEIGRRMPAEELLAMVDFNQRFGRRLAQWWTPKSEGGQGFDVLVTPTCGEPPPPLGEFGPAPGNPLAGYMRAAIFGHYTAPFNVSGQPAISLPLHWTPEGLPVGVQLVAPYGREDLLIRVAAQIEQAAPWAHRRPE